MNQTKSNETDCVISVRPGQQQFLTPFAQVLMELNRSFRMDPAAMAALCSARFPVSTEFADESAFPCDALRVALPARPDEDKIGLVAHDLPRLGTVGLLNGVLSLLCGERVALKFVRRPDDAEMALAGFVLHVPSGIYEHIPKDDAGKERRKLIGRTYEAVSFYTEIPLEERDIHTEGCIEGGRERLAKDIENGVYADWERAAREGEFLLFLAEQTAGWKASRPEGFEIADELDAMRFTATLYDELVEDFGKHIQDLDDAEREEESIALFGAKTADPATTSAN